MFALVDGNNFYCSCERVFRPSLVGKPVIVLSNNDGCAIARSNEAKALGIKMGQPWFECRALEQTHGLVALSANFQLYGDLSDRMMAVAGGFAPARRSIPSTRASWTSPAWGPIWSPQGMRSMTGCCNGQESRPA